MTGCYAIPGFMLWAAILYASAGSLLTPPAAVSSSATPSAMRVQLICALCASTNMSMIFRWRRAKRTRNGASSSISTRAHRDPTHRDGHQPDLDHRRLWLGHIVSLPYVVAAPLYFTGKVSFGGLMAAGAFTPGAVVSAMVHRQFQFHCRCALTRFESRVSATL